MRSWFAALLFLPGLAVAQPVDGFQTAVAVRAGSQTDPHISGTVIIWRDRFAIPGLDGQQAVLYRSTLNPLLGRNFEAMGPLEWLARMSDHIPDPGQHRTLFYGEYANRVRGERHPPEDEQERGRRGARTKRSKLGERLRAHERLRGRGGSLSSPRSALVSAGFALRSGLRTTWN